MQKEVQHTMTFSDLLAEKDIKLSPEQRAAVDADRAAIVSAGAVHAFRRRTSPLWIPSGAKLHGRIP